jgi:transcriptional regulator with XRE-family HTH domain
MTQGARSESGLYARIVEDVREGLTTAEVADITGVAERQVYNWLSAASRPKGENRDRLLEVHYIVELLADVYRSEGVDIWLHGRNRELGGDRPIDLLRAGRFEPVVHAVERLRSGAM